MQLRAAAEDTSGSPMRMFTSDDEGRVSYQDFSGQATAEVQYLPIVLVSIRSAFFQTQQTLSYMMRALHEKYFNPNVPIIHLCGDLVYENTRGVLFVDRKRDAIAKGRESWQKKYGKALEEFVNNGVEVNQRDRYWSAVTETQNYRVIKKFVDLIFTEIQTPLTEEHLETFLLSVNKDDLHELLQDIKKLKIDFVVEQITKSFKERNQKHVESANKESLNQHKINKQLAAALKSFGVVVSQSIESKESDSEHEAFRATARYLAEEWAVFLTLSSIRQTAHAREIFALEMPGLNEDRPVLPVLNYPISATSGSDLIFMTFQRLQALYIKYFSSSDSFKLKNGEEHQEFPIISCLSIVADIVIPEQYRPENFSRNSETDMSVVSSHLTKVSQNPLTMFPKSDDAKTRDTIVNMIMDDLKLFDQGVRTLTKMEYKNGVSCDISVQLPEGVEYSVIGDIKQYDSQIESLRTLIGTMISVVKSGECLRVDRSIECMGHRIFLAMRPTSRSVSPRSTHSS